MYIDLLESADSQQILSIFSADSQQILSRFSADSQQILSRFSADSQQILKISISILSAALGTERVFSLVNIVGEIADLPTLTPYCG